MICCSSQVGQGQWGWGDGGFPAPNWHESHVQDGHGQLPPGQIIHFTCRKSIMCLDSFLRLHLRKALNLKKLFYNFLSPVPATSWQRNCCRKVAEWCVKFLFAGTISTPLNLATKFSIVAKIRHLLVVKPHNYWGSKLKLELF